MGYTHYWSATQYTPDSEAYGHTLVDAKAIIEEARRQGITIVRDYDEPGTDPELTEGRIWLNGEGEDGHETFVFDAVPGSFTFCKTERKPYDAVVGAILIRAKVHYGEAIKISSDGSNEWDSDDQWAVWPAARQLVRDALAGPIGIVVAPPWDEVPSNA